MLLLNSFTPLSIHDSFQNMQTAHCMHIRTHSPSEPLASGLNAHTMLSLPSPDTVSVMPNKNLVWINLDIEHFPTLKQSISKDSWPIVHDGTSGLCSHMASFWHDRSLVAICLC